MEDNPEYYERREDLLFVARFSLVATDCVSDTDHESRITSHGLSSVVSPALAGLPLAGALALKAICGGAEYIGNVLISRQELEVLRSDGWEQV